MTRHLRGAALVAAAAALTATVAATVQPTVAIPEFWSEALLHDYELPLASPRHSPKHVSRDYYYALPERTLYKSYPIYHPSRDPAGQDVFEMPIDFEGPIVTMRMVRAVTLRRSTPRTSWCRPTATLRPPITTRATTFLTRAWAPIPP